MMFQTFHMPSNMAMQYPYPWVIGRESDDDMPLRRNGDRVPPHGVFKAPGCRPSYLILTGTPADNLECVSCTHAQHERELSRGMKNPGIFELTTINRVR